VSPSSLPVTAVPTAIPHCHGCPQLHSTTPEPEPVPGSRPQLHSATPEPESVPSSRPHLHTQSPEPLLTTVAYLLVPPLAFWSCYDCWKTSDLGRMEHACYYYKALY
jgi:hypothetical protein